MKDISSLDIFLLSQSNLAKYIINICKTKKLKYEFVAGKYIFIYGSSPGCLVAHLDTVHKQLPSKILKRNNNNKIEYYAKEGIGADDRAGVIAALYFLLNKKSYALFTFDEEIGGLGVKAFVKSDLFYQVKDDINIWIEYDRKGNNDYVTYGYENKNVFALLDSVDFKKNSGTYSDVATLSSASNVLGVNISSGYYNAHRLNEYFIAEELLNNISRIKSIYDELIDCKRECILIQPLFNTFSIHNVGLENLIKDYLLNDYYFLQDDYDEEIYNYYATKLAYIYEKYELDVDFGYMYEVEDAYEILLEMPNIKESDYKFYIEKYVQIYHGGISDFFDFETFIENETNHINNIELGR